MTRSCRLFFLGAALLGAASLAPAATEVTLNVQGFEVQGNRLLSGAELEPVLAPFKGPQTLAGLRAAAGAVQAAYRQAGWGAVVVSLPEQDLGSDARVRLVVLEGRLAKVGVIGTPRWGEAAVRAQVPSLQTGQTPRLARIDREIQLANEGGAALLALTLESGEKTGEVDAQLQVQTAPLQPWRLTLDNTGNHQTGPLRLGLAWQDPQWNAAGDVLGWQVQTSPTRPERVGIANLQYSHPLPAWLGRLDAYAGLSNVDGGDTPTAAGALRFNGKGHVLGLRLTRLLEGTGTVDTRVSAALDQRAYRNDCHVANLPDGACGPVGESVTVQPFSLELMLQPTAWAGSSVSISWSRNLGLGGAFTAAEQFEAVRPGAVKGFQILRVNAQAQLPAGKEARVLLRWASQYSGDGLVSGEQFGLAGANTVRGYAERELAGDSAVFGSAEWQGAAGFAGLRPSLFVDAGQARNQLGTDCRAGQTRCGLWSLGGGLRGSAAGSALQWKADLARAGKPANTTQRGDWRLHLNASWTL